MQLYKNSLRMPVAASALVPLDLFDMSGEFGRSNPSIANLTFTAKLTAVVLESEFNVERRSHVFTKPNAGWILDVFGLFLISVVIIVFQRPPTPPPYARYRAPMSKLSCVYYRNHFTD